MKKLFYFILFFTILCGSFCYQSHNAQAASPSKIRLNVKKLGMTKDSEYILRIYNAKKNQTIYFSSSDTSVVSLSTNKTKKKNVCIFTHGVGSATITATVKSKNRTIVNLQCQVTVAPPAISIRFPRRKLVLTVGESLVLKPILKPNTTLDIPLYESSNRAVATVNSKGKLIALSTGTAEIKAILPNGQFDTYIVTVVSATPSPTPSSTPQSTSKDDFINGT